MSILAQLNNPLTCKLHHNFGLKIFSFIEEYQKIYFWFIET